MLQTLIIFLLLSFYPDLNAQMPTAHKTSGLDKTIEQQIIITDQANNRIIIANVKTGKITWDWRPGESGIQAQDIEWFKAPSDAKAVYNNKYILLNASLGGVALVRIEDKKAVFYAYAGGNTHSAELLPDGNIVAASSNGNYLRVFATDTLQKSGEIYSRKIYLQDAHNVVWDKKRNVLWSAGKYKLYSLKYNFDCKHPDLTILDSITLPDSGAHDLFPVYGKDSLWLSTTHGVFKIAPSTKKIIRVTGNNIENIKSISSGPERFPTVVIIPKEKWWTEEVLDINGRSIFKSPGLKIYKARWILLNEFSYQKERIINLCK